MARISIPTTARLPSSLRIDPANPAVLKVLSRLSRVSLLTLVLDWLDENNQALCAPYLEEGDGGDDGDDDPEDFYPPAHSLAALRETYAGLQARKGSKREVLDRIVEGDWRHGLTLYQLAMADLQHLHDHPASQKWSAYRVLPLRTPTKEAETEEAPRFDREALSIPRFHPSTFLEKLQSQVLPDVKAHYQFDRAKDLPLLLLRIFILDSPYNTDLATASANGGEPASFDASRTVYVAFPDASPHVYISRSQQVAGPAPAGESKSLWSLVVEGIPKALSRPRERYALRPTSLSTRNLAELLHRRGAGRTNSAGGGWGIYADEKKRQSPLDTVLPTPPLSEADDGASDAPGALQEEKKKKKEGKEANRAVSPETAREERAAKRARLVAQARFGDSARMDDGRGVERVDIVIEDPFPEQRLADEDEEEEEERERGEGGAGAPSRGRGRTAGGRRSDVQKALDREQEQNDDSDEAGVAQGGDEDAGATAWKPQIRLTFHGPHVFAGVRQLVEHGIIDGERMPGWMAGDEGVTIGAVRHGRIQGHKGSGI